MLGLPQEEHVHGEVHTNKLSLDYADRSLARYSNIITLQESVT